MDDREYVRVIDLGSPRLKEFTLAPEYQPDPRWRVPRTIPPLYPAEGVSHCAAKGDDETVCVPGELEFPVRGRQFHLRAFAEPGDSTTLWLMFKDSTNLRDTYGAGRYLWVPAPDSTGWTIIDFNRAVSPPCEYTAYATCPLPPPENRLAAWIEAGEKRARQPVARTSPLSVIEVVTRCCCGPVRLDQGVSRPSGAPAGGDAAAEASGVGAGFRVEHPESVRRQTVSFPKYVGNRAENDVAATGGRAS